jgi:carboxymethylenebutenolidase
MIEAELTIRTADGEQTVVTKRPDGDGPIPVVVVFHDGPGMREGNHQVAWRIAEAGYYAFVPDRYYRKGKFVHVDPAELRAAGPDSEMFQQFQAVLRSVTDDMVLTDLEPLLDHIEADPVARDAPMGVIGFCIGARYVVRALAANGEVFAAGAALHPSFCATDQPDSPHLSVPNIKGSLYVGIGDEDKMQSVEMNQPFLDAVAAKGDSGSYDILPGADHGFAVPGPSYLDSAADRAYQQAFALFDRELV